MTNPQPNLVELAKKGDARAIAALMNRSLQPKGITAKALLKDNCLQIMLESSQALNQQALVDFIRRGITNLSIESLQRMKIYGRQVGEEIPGWSESIELEATDIVKATKLSVDSSSREQKSNPTTTVSRQQQTETKLKTRFNFSDAVETLGVKKIAALSLVAVALMGMGIFGALTLFGGNPEKTVDGFLTSLNKGDEQNGLKNWCFQSGQSLFAVKSWKIIRQERKKVEIDKEELLKHFPEVGDKVKDVSRLEYTQVTARIDSSNKGGSAITADWNFNVWKTSDVAKHSEGVQEIIDFSRKSTSETSSSSSNQPDLELERIKRLVEATKAQTDFLKATLSLTGDKSKITSEPYCIGNFEEKK